MRAVQRHPLARLLLAATIGVALTWATVRGGPFATGAVLFLLATSLAFVALTIAPDAIALQRGHAWRWWWRSSDDEGPFWPGTRVPRGPRRPL